jgi:hypothetical protein
VLIMANPPATAPRTDCMKAICRETAAVVDACFRDRLQAVVLTGSVARGEATIVRSASGGYTVLGDAEFLLIQKEHATEPRTEDIRLATTAIEDRLLAEHIRCHIELSVVHADFMAALKPQIFTYELTRCGQVIWGDEQILSSSPAFEASEIPVEDGWRTLCHRAIELLEASYQLDPWSPFPSDEVQYRTVKLYLDMGTSLLLFLGAYRPTYQARSERLADLAHSKASEQLPFEMARFADRVRYWTNWKLNPKGSRPDVTWSDWSEAIDYAHRLWQWELGRLAETAVTGDRELWRAWLDRQRPWKGLRGWAYALRKRGWHRSWKLWPHWTRLAMHASPRYWIYGIGCEICFQLPSLAFDEASGGAFDRDLHFLPDSGRSSRGAVSWRDAAAAVVSNYHDFVMGTSA